MAALLGIVGILGAVVLAFDNVLREGAPAHFDALIVFVIIDFALAILVVTKSSRTTFTVVMAWSLLQIILQIGDITQAPVYQFASYGQFADYLFNPLSTTATSLGNPLGVPGAFLDLMLLLQVITVGLAWKTRKAKGEQPQRNV